MSAANKSAADKENPVAPPRPTTHPELIDNDRNTKLHYLAAKNDVKEAEIQLQREKHVVDPQNYLGWTPLMMACRKGHLEMAKCLLSNRANVTLKNKFGMNVFQLAVASGNLELITYLLDHFLVGGISKRFMERDFPAVSLAILYRQDGVLEYLLEKDFDINTPVPGTGITPLMFAHAIEDEEATRQLLKHKADSKLRNRLGHTAADITNIRRQIKEMRFSQEGSTRTHHHHQRKAEFYSSKEERQNEQLRQALQVKPDNVLMGPPPQPMPVILVSPCFDNSSTVGVVPMVATSRKSSNVGSPFVTPPNITPIFAHLGGQPQVFFPPNFSPNGTPFNVSHVAQTSMNNNGDLLNARFYLSSPFPNYMSPCM